MKIKTIQQFQQYMKEVETMDCCLAANIYCIERRIFTNDHKPEKDFFATARQRHDGKYRVYYYYSNTMYLPKYATFETRDEALDDLRDTINRICL